MGFPLLEGLCLYTLLFPLLGDDNADLPTGPSISLLKSKPSAVEFSLLGVPALLHGFFPLRAPV